MLTIRCVVSSLGFLSCSIGLYFCFCASSSLDGCSFVVQHEVKKVDSSNSISFQHCFGYLGSLFQVCEKYCFSIIGITFNLQIALGNIVMFTILIIPIQENSISFHLFISSLISFINVLYFPVYRFFVSHVSCSVEADSL